MLSRCQNRLLPLVIIAIIFGSLALGACQKTLRPTPAPRAASIVVVEEPAWRKVATPQDLERLERIEESWGSALDRATKSGFGRHLAAEGALLTPQAALPRPEPPPGSYRCRLLRFGAERPGGRFFTAFPTFYCHVGVVDGQLSLVKQTGSERPAGYLWDDEDPRRLIFLGAAAAAKQTSAYGDEPARDRAGVFERVGPFQFRLVTPRLSGGRMLEVYELVPAPSQAKE